MSMRTTRLLRNLPIPDDLKLETYAIRKQEAVFDRVELAILFMPGKDRVGLIVKTFINAIANHDEIVKLIEEKWKILDGLKREFNKKNRLFRNLDSAWTTMNTSPEDFDEYLEMLPRMKNFEERIKKIRDSKAKAKAELERKRFNELDPICSKLRLVQIEVLKAREIRDAARKELVVAEGELNALREKEREVAALISDDHIVADETGVPMSEIFLNVHNGNVVSTVNGNDFENLEYDKAMEFLKRLRTPHKVEFKRYDYRFDPFNNVWLSLPALRELGVCIEDPMLARVSFVEAAGRGEADVVKRALLQGEDPNAADFTGRSALCNAAVNGHWPIVKMLIKAGANVNSRDKNMMTPLLSCVRRGLNEMIWQLKDFGADATVSDKLNRNATFYSLISGDEKMIRQFIKPTNCNDAESVWGFTPLHYAANAGRLALAKLLLNIGCSIYRKEKKGLSPEEVAKEAGHEELRVLLEEERLSAPAQLVHSDKSLEINVWIGDDAALDPAFCTEVGITHVVYLSETKERPPLCAWMLRDETVKHVFVVAEADDDDHTEESWKNLSQSFTRIMDFLIGVLKRGEASILICDPSGNSTSVAVLAAAFLLRFQMRIRESLEMCCVARPSVRVSLSMRRGLEFFEQAYDKKRLLRYEEKLRHSVMLSSSF